MKKNEKTHGKKMKKYINILFFTLTICSILWVYIFIKNNVYIIMTSDIIQDIEKSSEKNITANKLEELLNQIEEKNNIIKEKSSEKNIIYKNIFK
ncbi:MAG: hypothetical protein PHZ07_05165 [Patescibacteria group bacterium]|nr:hypothetical protein [Patescibacteria group bacterium]MDD4304810.1 hypothetical protein [Patescibacteria group bacterium]MDD4695860.1 hypothetical protein [Patescibacteria group bacterium]